MRHALTDSEWKVIQPIFRKSRRGIPLANDRLVERRLLVAPLGRALA